MAKLATVPSETRSDEQQIRDQIDEFAAAVRARDLDRMMSCYSQDMVNFDMMPPLKSHGIDNFRRAWEQGFSMMRDPIEFELRDIHVSASGDVAFTHSLNRMKFTSTEENKPMEMWVRWTAGFRKIKGKWLVTHEHVSVPIDMNTDKALYNVKP